MRRVLAAVGSRATFGRSNAASLLGFSHRWQSSGVDNRFRDVSDSNAPESPSHKAPDVGTPGSVDGDTYLHEVWFGCLTYCDCLA